METVAIHGANILKIRKYFCFNMLNLIDFSIKIADESSVDNKNANYINFFDVAPIVELKNYATINEMLNGSDKLEDHRLLESQNVSNVRICAISDTHGAHRHLGVLPECDILVHAGDIFFKGRNLSSVKAIQVLEDFNEWLGIQKAKYIIVIGGNHDKHLESLGEQRIASLLSNSIYLCNKRINVMGLNIFGVPFSQGHSRNKAFQSEKFAETVQNKISEILNTTTIDILITHDDCSEFAEQINPAILHICGHHHRSYGVFRMNRKANSKLNDLYQQQPFYYRICACIMDGNYRPTNHPFVVDHQVNRLDNDCS
jgi:predicted phosphodiesterase